MKTSTAVLPLVFATVLALAQPVPEAGFGELPVYFIANQGQVDGPVTHYVQGRDKSIFFTPDGVTFALVDTSQRWAAKLDFVGSDPDVTPRGIEETAAVVSYFRGPDHGRHNGFATFGGVRYAGLWPGVDAEFRGTVNRFKYQFTVAPGVDPNVIRLAYRGADVALAGDGGLFISTPAGSFRDDAPVAWQEKDGAVVEIPVAYEMEGESSYRFALGNYDPSLPLVIDPAVIVYSGFIGGVAVEESWGLAVGADGSAYVAGTTFGGVNYPAVSGPDLTYNGGVTDAFIAKVTPGGDGVVYAGFIGGDQDDTGEGVAVDSSGNAYVTGFTLSTQNSFPTQTGPDVTHNGALDVYVAKIDAAGTTLVYSGYVGGAGDDIGLDIAVDQEGSAYLTGFTSSDETSFPVVAGPDLTYNLGSDVFVAKVKADGSGLDYCGYIGGDDFESATGIAVDELGNAYIAGATRSIEATFPTLIGPALNHSGNMDGFVSKVKPDGTGLDWSGYIGGYANDRATRIAESQGSVYVSGFTESPDHSFPVTVGPDLTFGGDRDGFVAKLNPDAAIAYCGYIGGSGLDEAYGIAVDPSGNAYVSGRTRSTAASLPVVDGPDLTHNGLDDAFVAKVSSAGSVFDFLGYIGGSGTDQAQRAALDAGGAIYESGFSDSDENSFPVTLGPGLTNSGGSDAFIVKLEGGPSINPDGIVNAASYYPSGLPNSGIAQGSLFIVTGKGIGPDALVIAPSIPWSDELGGVSMSVTVNGVTRNCFLYYVSGFQNSGVLPSDVPVGEGTLTVTYDGKSVTAPIRVVASAFGMFTRNQGGFGPAIVQNWNSPTDQPVNGLTEAANPWQTEIIWGTGLGGIEGGDSGPPPVGPINAQVEVLVGDRVVPPTYAGRTGMGVPSVDQINFVIPDGVYGCRVPLAVRVNGVVSNFGTMAIAREGKVCSDESSYARETLETLMAKSGPLNLGAVAVQRIELDLAGPQGTAYGTLESAWGRFWQSAMPEFLADSGMRQGSVNTPGSCIVYSMRLGNRVRLLPAVFRPRGLDAGEVLAISIEGQRLLYASAKGVYDPPGSIGGGVPGAGEITPEFIKPGWPVAENTPGGPDVGGFQQNIYMPATVTWTNRDSIGQIARGQDMVVTWEPSQDNREIGEAVLIAGYSENRVTRTACSFICTARVSDGTFTIPARVLSSLPANTEWTGTGVPTGLLLVGTTPTGDRTRIEAAGLDFGQFFYWNWTGKNVDFQ